MNLQSLIVVVLRLMALNFLLRAAVELTPSVLPVLSTRSSFDDALAFMALPLLVVVGIIAAAAAIWFLARPIARIVTRGVSRELSFGAISLVDCYSIAFMAVGLLHICSHLPRVLNWGHFFLVTAASARGSSGDTYSGYDVSQAFVPFIVGVVLFVKGRAWAVALARNQGAAESPNQSVEATADPPSS